jgi:hypothetical protein
MWDCLYIGALPAAIQRPAADSGSAGSSGAQSSAVPSRVSYATRRAGSIASQASAPTTYTAAVT